MIQGDTWRKESFYDNNTLVPFIARKEPCDYIDIKAGICVARAHKIKPQHLPTDVSSIMRTSFLVQTSSDLEFNSLENVFTNYELNLVPLDSAYTN